MCRNVLAREKVVTIDSIIGPKPRFANYSLPREPPNLTGWTKRKTRLSIPPSYVPIKMRPEEKGDRMQRIGTLSRRFFNKNPCSSEPVRLADTGYDSDELRKAIREEKMKAVIYPPPNRKHNKPRLNRKIYAKRISIENFFHHLK